MLLINLNDKPVEFMYGGQVFIFKPGESRDLPENIAEHALNRAHAPLVLHTPMYDKEVKFSETKYSDLPWKELISMASARGLFKPGTPRVEVEKALEDYDTNERGTLQGPLN